MSLTSNYSLKLNCRGRGTKATDVTGISKGHIPMQNAYRQRLPRLLTALTATGQRLLKRWEHTTHTQFKFRLKLVTIRHMSVHPSTSLRYATASKIWLQSGFLQELAIAILR